MRRILTREEITERCAALRREGRRIVFTNGCFDILHIGHAQYLEIARSLGDVLIVGINDDASVRRLKGNARPVMHETDRAGLVASLRAVDFTSIFGEDTPYELIRAIEPDVLVKGGDYDPAATEGPRYIVGSDVVRSRGGEVRVIEFVEGRSTSGIIDRIRSDC
ncbi:MAG TPA: D-glycero-beta-D-manno-heptose 1-phosphate adenylyltransferase [Candidatus Kapabacteria bacterium]|nr:D-glycero-beta-D-manno-heptose 1-phosphate adenylyltransferase [Candidatus Kapabacteria bacterium]